MRGDYHGHCYGHRASGAGDLGACSAEYSGEEADRDSPVYAGERAEPGGDAEGQRNGQSHHCGGDAAEEVATEGLEVVAEAKAPSLFPRGLVGRSMPFIAHSITPVRRFSAPVTARHSMPRPRADMAPMNRSIRDARNSTLNTKPNTTHERAPAAQR